MDIFKKLSRAEYRYKLSWLYHLWFNIDHTGEIVVWWATVLNGRYTFKLWEITNKDERVRYFRSNFN